ncbi:MAG: LptA/OstA family protein [Thermoanaerobaculia bacterium]
MVRSVRIFRILLPILFLGFLVVLAVNYTRGDRQDRGVSEAVTSTIREDDSPQLVAYAFDDVQTIGGRVVSQIRAQRTIGFASGWYTLEDVWLTIYQENGGSYQLRAPQAQFHHATKEARADGGVRVTSSDGTEIITESIAFDGNRLVNRVPVRFVADNWRGRAGGVDFNLGSERLDLTDSVEATMQSVPPAPPITVRADNASFDRSGNEAAFRGSVEIDRAGDTLRTETITARIDQEKKVLTGLEGCCGVEFGLGSGSAVAGGAAVGDTVVNGERFFTEIGPEGVVRALFIEGGEGSATARMAGPPRRSLRGGRFRVVFAGKGISELEAAGSALLEEQGPTLRTISASKLVTYFDAARSRPTSARGEGSVEFRDARNRATAQRATFDFIADKLVLASVPGALPSIASDTQTLTAQEIRVTPGTGVLEAEGFVKARFEPASRETGGMEQTGIFPASTSPVYVNADRLILQQQSGAGRFTGNVRAWQDQNLLLSKEMRIEDQGETLVATGGVRAVLYNAERESSVPIKASASTLTARRGERKAILEDKVRIEDEGRVLTAGKAVFLFDTTQKLERVEASEGVTIAESATRRSGAGEQLVYSIPKRTIQLEGSPASVEDPQGTVKGSEIVFDLERNKVDVLRGEGQTEATYIPRDGNQE